MHAMKSDLRTVFSCLRDDGTCENSRSIISYLDYISPFVRVHIVIRVVSFHIDALLPYQDHPFFTLCDSAKRLPVEIIILSFR